MALVDALWVGGFEAELTGGVKLIPGETVVEVPEAEAKASANWEIVSKGKSKDKAD